MRFFSACWTVLLLCTVIFAGCATTIIGEGPAPGMRVESPNPYSAGIRMNSVSILDKDLQKWYVFENTITGSVERGKKGKIAVESTGSRRTPTGTVEAWAVLRNRTDFDLQVQGRVQFFDKTKAPVEGPTAWQRVFLPANSVSHFKELSINVMDVAYYYIEIREGR